MQKRLRELMEKYYSLDELRTLCFDLDLDYESLPGDAKPQKVRELITHCQRNDIINELLKSLRESRPSAPWPKAPKLSSSKLSHLYSNASQTTQSSLVIDTIIDLKSKLQNQSRNRKQAVSDCLQHLGFSQSRYPHPQDFAGLYTYALVHFGIDKPEPILRLLAVEQIQAAFKKSFENDDKIVLENAIKVTLAESPDKMFLLYDPYNEFVQFEVLFYDLLNSALEQSGTNTEQEIPAATNPSTNISKLNKMAESALKGEAQRLKSQIRKKIVGDTISKLNIPKDQPNYLKATDIIKSFFSGAGLGAGGVEILFEKFNSPSNEMNGESDINQSNSEHHDIDHVNETSPSEASTTVEFHHTTDITNINQYGELSDPPAEDIDLTEVEILDDYEPLDDYDPLLDETNAWETTSENLAEHTNYEDTFSEVEDLNGFEDFDLGDAA